MDFRIKKKHTLEYVYQNLILKYTVSHLISWARNFVVSGKIHFVGT